MDPLSLIPAGSQYDILRWTLSILRRDFPDLYATLRADRVSGWVAEIDSGTGRDADQIRDDITRYIIGVDRLMATYGITREMAELVILGGNEGGINFSDLTPLPTPPQPGDTPTPAPPAAPPPPDIEDPTPPPGTEPDPTPVDFREQAGLLFPYLPSQLLDIFADAWADTGDVNLALATMRADPTYDTFFPGNRREDGSLRMSEAEYFSRVDAYNKAFRGWGLNPELFKGKYATLIAGDVTGATLANRIAAAHEQVLHQMPQVREVYARYAGIELSDEAILASFLDPDVADGILSRRIAVSQVGAEGEARGFTINLPFAERLHFAGVDQQRAREFFTSAEGRVPTLDELARRFADPDPDFDIVEFAEAAVFGSASQERRVRRLLAAEASLFSDQLGAVRTTGSDFALTGLNPV